MATYRDGLAYKTEFERQVMLAKAGKRVTTVKGAPKLTEKDKAFVESMKPRRKTDKKK